MKPLSTAYGARRLHHAVGVGVAAQARLALEQHHLVLARQLPRRAQARDAAADHGDPHAVIPRAGRAHVGRDRLEVADQAQQRHRAQAQVGEVELPPGEALARRAREMVVVVVPALAEGDQRQEGVVAAVVAGGEAARAPEMRQRIDGDRGMEQHDRRHEEAPHQQLRAVGAQLRMGAFKPAAQRVQARRQQRPAPGCRSGRAGAARGSARGPGCCRSWCRSRARVRNQPMWLRKKPCARRMHVRAVSAWRWWWRWCAAHHSGPRCTDAAPITANANCTGREVLNALWAK